MGRRKLFAISRTDRASLEKIVHRGKNWRERERAKTLLLLDDGLSTDEVAAIMGLNFRTVGTTRSHWLETGFDSLPDLPRSGAPRKLASEDVDKLVALASAEPLSAKALLAKHVEDGGTLVQLRTLTNTLKSAGLVWKRTRHSLKKKE